MERCIDCIHFKACEDWVISFRNYEETTFPYEAENNLCDYFEPVAHGEWIGDNGNQPYDDYKCNHCGYYTETRNRSRLDNYCGNCGARMDGGNE